MTVLRQKMIEEMQLTGKSDLTQKNYIQQIKNLSKYYNLSPDKLSKEDIRNYILYLINDDKKSASAVNVALSGINFLYRQVLNWKKEDIGIPYQKQDRKLPIVLNRQEIKRLIETPKNLKHKAVISMLYASGCRNAELCRLQIADIDSGRMLVRINLGKGRKDRYTLLGDYNLSILREYWNKYKPRLWLFPGQNPKKPYSTHTVENVVKTAAKKCGIIKHVRPHILRHSFATHLAENGVNIRIIQKLLGHKNIRTTMKYIHITNVTIEKVSSPIDSL